MSSSVRRPSSLPTEGCAVSRSKTLSVGENAMRIVACWPLALLLAMLAAMPASAQINPFRSGRTEPGLSNDDLNMLTASANRLNNGKNVKVGSSESWSNPSTGSHGIASVTQILERNGLPCRRLHHEFTPQASNSHRKADLIWCRTSDGEW